MALDEDIARLSRIGLFAALEREALRLIAFAAERQSFAAGDYLFRAGEKADCGWFILSGEVTVESGARRQIASRDSLVGEMALLAEIDHAADARALAPVEAMRISRSLIKRVLKEFPDSAVGLHKALTERLRALTGRLDMARRRVIEPRGF